ncbi:low molecular weight phosphatase family protein [soil metagenome]
MGVTTILTVCTGNICRSPLAEQLLRVRLDPEAFSISSAGTAAMVGDPMDPDAAEQSRLLGGDPDGFVSRQLRGGLIVASDLVLTATRAHRDTVMREYPRAAQRVFTLAEFAALREADVAAAAAARESARSAVKLTKRDDVIDPYGLSTKVHAASAAQTDRLTREIARILSD